MTPKIFGEHDDATIKQIETRVAAGGERFWVVRKGATPAFPGQKGFVGGSMGDDAVIIEGVDSPVSRDALFPLDVAMAGRDMVHPSKDR